MTTPHWTIDDFPEDLVADLCSALTMGLALDDSDEAVDHVTDILNAIAPHLVADVAAARLVDDMAAVIRRLLGGWRTGERRTVVEAGAPHPDPVPIWMHGGAKASDYDSEPMSPGEVAALHHARQQEGSR